MIINRKPHVRAAAETDEMWENRSCDVAFSGTLCYDSASIGEAEKNYD